MADCPTCAGTGSVPAHVADALVRAAAKPAAPGGTCWCDGPQHPYSLGWCPKTGPVTR